MIAINFDAKGFINVADINDVNDLNEAWLPVVGAEGLYEVSSFGRVRSLPRVARRTSRGTTANLTIPGKIMTWSPNGGYPRVTLRIGGETVYRMCHVLVAAAFLGPKPSGQEVRHKDGNRWNPRLCNLEYGTRAENIADAKRHGTFCAEDRRTQAKLTADQARTIATSEGTLAGIATQFGISASVVYDIKTGRSWRMATSGLDRVQSNGTGGPQIKDTSIIPEIYLSDDRAVDIAARYGISQNVVNQIRSRKTYRRLTEHLPVSDRRNKLSSD